MVQLSLRTLVLPLEGVAGAGGVVARDRTCRGVGRVVIDDYQAVYREGALSAGDLVGPAIDAVVYVVEGGCGYQLALHGGEPQAVQQRHAVAPRVDCLVGIDQRKGYPLDVAAAYLVDVFQRERARSQVAGVGILFVALHIEYLKVLVGYHRLATYHEVALVVYVLGDAADGWRQMGDVGAGMTVAARHDLAEQSLVVGHHEGEAVEFPRHPDGALLGPLHQVGRTLGLGERQGGKLMVFFLAGDVVF